MQYLCITNQKDMELPTTTDIAMAKRYSEHKAGNAYIPPQDMVRYERAYKKVYDFNHK